MGWGLSPISNSSYNFSPGRKPVVWISMSPVGLRAVFTCRPESSTMRCARSMMRTGWPMSSTNTSPPCAMAPACITNWAASGMVMK
ncbi:hypothetical protein D9M69_697880 [compost metagenome]